MAINNPNPPHLVQFLGVCKAGFSAAIISSSRQKLNQYWSEKHLKNNMFIVILL